MAPTPTSRSGEKKKASKSRKRSPSPTQRQSDRSRSPIDRNDSVSSVRPGPSGSEPVAPKYPVLGRVGPFEPTDSDPATSETLNRSCAASSPCGSGDPFQGPPAKLSDTLLSDYWEIPEDAKEAFLKTVIECFQLATQNANCELGLDDFITPAARSWADTSAAEKKEFVECVIHVMLIESKFWMGLSENRKREFLRMAKGFAADGIYTNPGQSSPNVSESSALDQSETTGSELSKCQEWLAGFRRQFKEAEHRVLKNLTQIANCLTENTEDEKVTEITATTREFVDLWTDDVGSLGEVFADTLSTAARFWLKLPKEQQDFVLPFVKKYMGLSGNETKVE